MSAKFTPGDQIKAGGIEGKVVHSATDGIVLEITDSTHPAYQPGDLLPIPQSQLDGFVRV